MRPGLSKSKSTSTAELLKQPVFENPLITNQEGRPLGFSGRSEGNAFANACCSRIKDLRDQELQAWKGLSALGMSFHPVNRQNRDRIIAGIPWDPTTSNNKPRVGDWVSKKDTHKSAPPEWVYQIMEMAQTSASIREFRRTSPVGRIRATNSHSITIPLKGYEPIRVLAQEGYGMTFRLARDLPPPRKKPPIYWIFESSFISDLSWDLGDWHWQKTHNMEDAPFFGYFAKRGYQNPRSSSLTPSIVSFTQNLNLRNTTTAQIIAKMWHNARPRKVGALIWLTLNNGLPEGTWLQKMGVHASCQGCAHSPPESPQHCLLDYLPA